MPHQMARDIIFAGLIITGLLGITSIGIHRVNECYTRAENQGWPTDIHPPRYDHLTGTCAIYFEDDSVLYL